MLFAADCIELFARVRDNSIDCIFADPPFNLGKDYGHGRDRDELEKSDYLEWSFRWIDEAVRVVRPGGAIFIYILPQ